MKYFAILRDSLRETVDSKVLYVLFLLSTLVIAFVASIYFKPGTAEETFRQFTNRNIYRSLDNPLGGGRWKDNMAQFEYRKVEQLGGDKDSPLGEYKFTLLRYPPSGKNQQAFHDQLQTPALKPGENPNNVAPKQKAEQEKALADYIDKAKEDVKELFQKAEELDLIKVTDIKMVPPSPQSPYQVGQAVQFEVTLQGTSRTRRLWAHTTNYFFGALEGRRSNMLGMAIFELAQIVVMSGSWVAILMGVVITSSFIPNMLRKGTVDLLLVKPIHRWALMMYKYIGGLTFIFLVITYFITGVWLALGFRTGIWGFHPLLLIPFITFFFAILYGISAFVAVMTRSAIACILLTCGCWFFFFLIGVFNLQFKFDRQGHPDRDEGAGKKSFAQLTRSRRGPWIWIG